MKNLFMFLFVVALVEAGWIYRNNKQHTLADVKYATSNIDPHHGGAK